MSRRRQTYSQAPRPDADLVDPEGPGSPLVAREWLVTNGLGGYAFGTVSGVVTRRFHGLLVAALPTPHGRTMMLNHVADSLELDGGGTLQLSAQAVPGHDGAALAELEEFVLEDGLPVWRWAHDELRIERRVLMPHRQNTTLVTYRLLAGRGPVCLVLEPYMSFRRHDGPLDAPLEHPYALHATDDRYEVCTEGGLPPLRLRVQGPRSVFRIEHKPLRNVRYRVEQSRGYDAQGDLYGPGVFRADLDAGSPVTLLASTESWDVALALSAEAALRAEAERRERLLLAAHPAARRELGGELVYAADQFLVEPAGRVADAARARARGDVIGSVIAGYPWFTDWGRDTMIALEGLTLVTGRHREAGCILRTFAHYVKDGLIPNMFPEGKNAGLYHTADATLWFFHALHRYVEATGDRTTLRSITPLLASIVEHHLEGTHFGIGIDPDDGLLRQGAPGYQLTWMDAKVGDLVVTPRRGKAVELNALWYSALRLLEGWTRDEGGEAAQRYAALADRARASFHRRFWSPEAGYLLDVVDGEGGDDASFRPNQLLAISLDHAVLDRQHWPAVVTKVHDRLLTPVGLRTLAPDHPEYRSRYFGDLRARDLAYHQGTVWAWLIGPFIDAWLKTFPDERARAREIVQGFSRHLDEAGVGTVSEIFDAEPPYTPRGCVAQAWSVAELLRCLVKTEG